ncbi:MAG TPA: hypothetical protein PKN61_15735 [Acidobacteriota bacterium]|jgi:hypothetical protein|nr:hypothetical protein [Phycisphaerae bacterium]HNR40487.1 hypothetical protein [Acidobacteriota bacterium]HNU02363.1 hypothetical protein [Acidobacteriota bacterium]
MPGGRFFLLYLLLMSAVMAQSSVQKPAEPSRRDLEFLAKVTAVRPFLEDCPDLRTDPQSIGRFFTPEVYARLRGNAYYGYQYDEGFAWPGGAVCLDPIRNVSSTQPYQEAFTQVLREALRQRGLRLESRAAARIGLCLVGAEPRQTVQSLPGIMVEVYFTNTKTGKSFFWRFGVGSRDGFSAALVDASDIIAELLLQKVSK